MNTPPGVLSRRATLTVLALTAGSIVATEVLLTRVLSVAAYYGLAFAILALAMLGLSAGALAAAQARRRGDPLGPWLAQRLVAFAGCVIAAAVVTATVPMTFVPNLSSFFAVLIITAACAAPMVAGGAIVARILGESSMSVSALYGVDLASAALGALVPLVLLGPLSGPSALLAVAAALAVAGAAIGAGSTRTRWTGAGLASLALAVILVTETTSAGLVIMFPKGRRRGAEPPVYEAWNALSHVEVRPFAQLPARSVLWAASPKTPDGTYSAAYGVIDGDAGTFVHAYDDLRSLDVLRYDASTVIHRLRPDGAACVIGVGGGRDVLAALVAGHDHVLGVEINPAIAKMLAAVSNVSPLLRDPRFELRVGDGRMEIARSGGACRSLQATLVDTWAATSAGAFAHTEATVYTLEAWRLFLRRVEPDGLIGFSRWYDAPHIEETARLVSLAVASLLDRGVTRPRDHVALIASGNIATILVDPAPFSPADLEALHAINRDLGFPVVLAPDKPPVGSVLDCLMDTQAIDDLGACGAPLELDTSPPTDDRPFFFQLRSARAWLHPFAALFREARGGVLGGNAAAMFQLLLTLIAVVIVGLALLGPTLFRALRSRTPDLPGPRAAVYFGCLGAGFMMVEMALVQRMHVVLGHPSYALVVVLAGLLFATGVGSAISPFVLRTRASVGVATLAAALVLVLLPYVVIGPLARATLESGLAVHAAWTGATAALVGLLLGMLFPSAIRYADRETGVPVALAINGFTSVFGSAAAIVVSVWAGIPATFVVAGIVYLAAGMAGPAGWRMSGARAGVCA